MRKQKTWKQRDSIKLNKMNLFQKRDIKIFSKEKH